MRLDLRFSHSHRPRQANSGTWIDALLDLHRDETSAVRPDVAQTATALYNAGYAKTFGCDEAVFTQALVAANEPTIKAIIAESFADIFFNNCFQNGVLPIRVSREDLDKLMEDAERGANATMTIDLEAQEIQGPDGGVVKFDIDAFRKHCMLNGLDGVGLTIPHNTFSLHVCVKFICLSHGSHHLFDFHFQTN